MTYYVIRNQNTGEYWRGKGSNRWGKYFNQAAIYRVLGQAKVTLEDIFRGGGLAEIVPIQIKIAEYGRWMKPTPVTQEFCSNCRLTPKLIFGMLPKFCPNCGVEMNPEVIRMWEEEE